MITISDIYQTIYAFRFSNDFRSLAPTPDSAVFTQETEKNDQK